MICIVTALYAEASPFIQEFSLKKNSEFHKTEVFENEEICLVVSGTGKIQSAVALATVLCHKQNIEKILNIGICGSADPAFAVGEMILVHEIRDFSSRRRYYPDILFDFAVKGAAVTTFDRPLVQQERMNIPDKLEIVDMEASGFYEAAIKHVTADRIQVLKVVSDHLEGIRCTPDLVNRIFAENLEKMKKIIFHLPQPEILFSSEETEFLDQIAAALRFSETQKHAFYDMAKSYKIRTRGDFSILQSYLNAEVKHKKEAKDHFETIRRLLFA